MPRARRAARGDCDIQMVKQHRPWPASAGVETPMEVWRKPLEETFGGNLWRKPLEETFGGNRKPLEETFGGNRKPFEETFGGVKPVDCLCSIFVVQERRRGNVLALHWAGV